MPAGSEPLERGPSGEAVGERRPQRLFGALVDRSGPRRVAALRFESHVAQPEFCGEKKKTKKI